MLNGLDTVSLELLRLIKWPHIGLALQHFKPSKRMQNSLCPDIKVWQRDKNQCFKVNRERRCSVYLQRSFA